MRQPRNFVPDRCYHLISRIANYFAARYITPMKESGLIAPVNAASLHPPWQAYRLTPKGRKVLS